MDIAAGLSAIATALSITKSLADTNAELDKAELKLRLAEVYSALADARISLTDAKARLAQKDLEIQLLRDKLNAPPDVILVRGFPFRVEGERVTAGPYCPNCHERGSLVLLGRAMTTMELCPRCQGAFKHAPTTATAQNQLKSG